MPSKLERGGFTAENFGLGPARRTETRKDVLDQKRQVLGPFAQRGQPNFEHRQPVVEVGPETPRVDFRLQAAIGGRDDSDVHRHVAALTDALQLLALEHAQKLRLELEAQLADLVEEDGAVLSRLERALRGR